MLKIFQEENCEKKIIRVQSQGIKLCVLQVLLVINSNRMW